MEKIKFKLDGCDISFVAQAPKDITLEQLLRQCNRIIPYYCACGINSNSVDENDKVELDIDYDDVRKLSEDVSCTIKDDTYKLLLGGRNYGLQMKTYLDIQKWAIENGFEKVKVEFVIPDELKGDDVQ